MLIQLRKIFIIFNALIGVYIVFKTTGFSSDNILVGFVNMGYSYIKMLYNFTKTLFHWFVELFDHKIVPNVPGDTPKPKFKTPFWNPEPLNQAWNYKLYDLTKADPSWFKSPLNISIETRPWYKDWSTLLWVAGGIVTIGTLYLSYKVIMDPSLLFDWLKSNPKITTTGPSPDGNTPNVELRDVRTPNLPGPSTGPDTLAGSTSNSIKDFSRGIANIYSKTIYNLNPVHWFATSKEVQDAMNIFRDQQRDINRYNRNFFPFTDNNPYDSWFKKLRLSWLGETGTEQNYRLELRKVALREADEVWRKGKEIASSLQGSPMTTSASIYNSPVPTTLGLRSSLTTDAFSGFSKLSPLSSPISTSMHNLPTIELPTNVNIDWSNHNIDKTIDPKEALSGWRTKKAADYMNQVSQSPPSINDELDDTIIDSSLNSYNKYSVLDEEYI